MDVGLNFNSLSVDERGRVSFSGLGTGIDFEAAVDQIIAAKRIPAVTLETRITDNDAKIVAFEELRSALSALKSSLSRLRGAVSIGDANNIFKAKSVFASTTRSDGSAPSAANNLVGITVANSASLGSHEVEVRRVATAHKITSNTFSSTTAALGLSGNFSIGGGAGATTIAVSASDTLLDIRDRINSANSGIGATGVSASIVSIASNQHVLMLTGDKPGRNINLFDSGSVLSGLGLSATNGVQSIRNGLAAGSKIEAGDGFAAFNLASAAGDSTFLVSYASATSELTLTRGDGASETVVLNGASIAPGSTETASFVKLGVSIVLDSNFNKSADIVVAADTASVSGGTGTIDNASIAIRDSAGDISGITGTAFGFANLATPGAITISAGAFSGTFDGTTTGAKSVVLSDGSGNSLTLAFTVATAFDGSETAASITLNELQNLASATGSYSNVAQVAQTARLTADGLTDGRHHESLAIANQTAQLGTLLSSATFPGSFDVNGTGTGTINYTSTDTLQTLRDKINAETATTGVTATIVADGTGFRLDLDSNTAFTLTDSNGLLGELGVNNKLVIERNSNTVSDLFTGVTLSLFAAENGTTIKIDIERDLTTVKSEILGFADAYNAARAIINSHQLVDPATGLKSEDSGVLFGERAVGDAQLRLAAIAGNDVGGVSTAFSTLAQIGIAFVNNATISDPLLKSTLVVDETTLDNALLNNPEDVRRLFGFDFSSSDPRVSLTDFNGSTTFNANGYTVNINYDDRFQSDVTIPRLDAKTDGLANDGISAIQLGAAVASGDAFRYSYDASSETLTLLNLTAGTSESVDITTLLDNAAGTGLDLGAGQSATVTFATLDVTVTLSGADNFTRATNIAGGALDSSGLDANTTLSGGTVTLPTSGINRATLDALIAAGAYNPATGALTLGLTSSGAGEAHFDTAAGLLFQVDGGAISADISAIDLDDGAAHTIGLYVNDGVGNVKLADLDFTALASTATGSGAVTIDLGTGLFADKTADTSPSVAMSNFLSFSNGSFEIRSSSNTLLGTVNYTTADSLDTLAANISAIAGITATVITDGKDFKLEIVEDANDAITLSGDSGGLVAQLNLIDRGDSIFSANINGPASGADDGSASVSGNSITATSATAAEGLKLFFSGNTDLSGTDVDFTVGVAADLFFSLDSFIDQIGGSIQAKIASLEAQNTLAQNRIQSIDDRLVIQRDSLLQRFIAMEVAVTQMNQLLEQLRAQFGALESDNGN